MEVVYWIFIGIMVIVVLFGTKDWIVFILTSFATDGAKTAIYLTGLFVLLITPGVVKMFVPKYYGLSLWALILYVVSFLVYRHLIVGTNNEGKEGS